MTSTGLEINKQDLKRVVAKLQSLPSGVRRNAATSALNAGARVVRDRARTHAPACLKRTIKNVRLKNRDGYIVTAVVAGHTGLGSRPIKAFGKLNDTFCVPAIWVELGTYGRRNLARDPYSPNTLRKKSYASGRSDSPFWQTPKKWIPATPFMRPAIMSASKDGSIEKAMITKLDEYFVKKGIR